MESQGYRKLKNLINEKLIEGGDEIFLEYNSSEISFKKFKDLQEKVVGIINNLTNKFEPILILGDKSLESFVATISSVISNRHFIIIKDSSNISKVLNIIKETKSKNIFGDEKNLLNLKKKLLKNDFKKELFFINLNGIIFKIEGEINSKSKEEKIEMSNICYVLYTSGSTGIPKGVLINHKSLFSFLISINKVFKNSKNQRISQLFDQSFDPSIFDLFFALLTKSTLCIPDKNDILLPFEYISKRNISFLSCTPTLISILDNYGFLSENIFPNIKNTILCGESLDTSLANKWFLAAPNTDFYNAYGPTEATIFVSIYKIKKNIFENKVLSVPIGKPIEGVEFEAIDDDEKLIKENICKGQLIISGDQLANGYREDEFKTKEKFRSFKWDLNNQRLWYLTGDKISRDAKGNYIFLGRIDNQIKIRGQRIEVEEIENVLRKYCFLDNAIVIPNKKNGITISTICFSTIDLDKEKIIEIKKNASKYIDSLFIPSHFKKLNVLPKTPSGKVDRNKIKLL